MEYFHVCNGSLIPDIMHDVLEGALQYEVKLMLQFILIMKAISLSRSLIHIWLIWNLAIWKATTDQLLSHQKL